MTKEEAQAALLKSNFKDPNGVVDFEGTLQSYYTYVKPQNDDPKNFIPYIKIGEKEFTLQEYTKLVSDTQ